MAGASAQENAEKWAQKYGASSEAYKKGVNRVTESPMQKAVAQQSALLNNFTQSVVSGKWARNTGAVQLPTWKTACTEKGAPAIAAAARVGAEKYARKEAQNKPIRDQIRASLPPRGTIEENMERSRQMAMGMHEASLRG